MRLENLKIFLKKQWPACNLKLILDIFELQVKSKKKFLGIFLLKLTLDILELSEEQKKVLGIFVLKLTLDNLELGEEQKKGLRCVRGQLPFIIL